MIFLCNLVVSVLAQASTELGAGHSVAQDQSQVGVSSIQRNQASEISKSRYWHRLLHAKPRWFGGVKSDASQQGFFISPEGRTDPESELWADLEAFALPLSPTLPASQHAQCLYPERFRYLSEQLGLKIPPIECTDFKKWKKELGGDSVALIFSSFFGGAPASMFGHTFLRVSNKNSVYVQRSGTQVDILDFAVDFAAMTRNDQVILEALYGLIGVYPGKYHVWPYYIKVKEYNNSERRDLYEYELSLSQSETDRLVNHLWELGHASFNYYFIDSNCSYQLLTLLEVAKPDWDMTSHFYGQVLPVDTVKAVLSQPGALKNVKFRPALSKKLYQKWSFLNSTEKQLFSSIIQGEKEADQIQNPWLAEAINIHYGMNQIENQGKLKEAESKIFHSVLLRRSRLGSVDDSVLPAIEESRPDLAHHSARVGLSGGATGIQAFQELSWRLTLHDLLDSDVGYTPYSQLEFMGLRLRYLDDSQKFHLQEAKLLQITNLSPWNSLEKSKSYRVDLSLRTPHDLGCETCTTAYMAGGLGLSAELGSRQAIGFVLAEAEVEAGQGIDRGGRFGPSLFVGMIGSPAPLWKVMATSRFHYFVNQDHPKLLELELGNGIQFSQSFQMRATAHVDIGTQLTTPPWEVSLSLLYYY